MNMDAITLARLLHARTGSAKVETFLLHGGEITPPARDAAFLDEFDTMALFGGKCGWGLTPEKAVEDWISTTAKGISIRATDGRLDCPYNGQPPLPPISPSTRPETCP